MPHSPTAIRAMTRAVRAPVYQSLCINPASLSLKDMFPLPAEMVFHTAIDQANALDVFDLQWFDALGPAGAALVDEVEASRASTQESLGVAPAMFDNPLRPPDRTPSPPPPSCDPTLFDADANIRDESVDHRQWVRDGPYITPPAETNFVPNVVAEAQPFILPAVSLSPSPPLLPSPVTATKLRLELLRPGGIEHDDLSGLPAMSLSVTYPPSPTSTHADDDLATPPTPSSPVASPTGCLGWKQLLNAGPTPVRRLPSVIVSGTPPRRRSEHAPSITPRKENQLTELCAAKRDLDQNSDGWTDRDADGETLPVTPPGIRPSRPTRLVQSGRSDYASSDSLSSKDEEGFGTFVPFLQGLYAPAAARYNHCMGHSFRHPESSSRDAEDDQAMPQAMPSLADDTESASKAEHPTSSPSVGRSGKKRPQKKFSERCEFAKRLPEESEQATDEGVTLEVKQEMMEEPGSAFNQKGQISGS
ncbi:hypothetical protein Q5752_000061 [Cryptotrichosporon argae]